MPEMSGTEFLTEARNIYPSARKVLLTAYADTEAAIDSINKIELDYYLKKPWDPPEELMYPVLDDLLDDWLATVPVPYDGIRVAGTLWSAKCHEVKDFLSRNRVPYQWLDIELDKEAKDMVDSTTGGHGRLPVLFFPDGSVLVEPDHRILAEKAGLQTEASLPFYDLIIIGAGPAGLGAGVYGASEGLRTIMIEREATGGQAGTSSRIENYLGFPKGLSGADLARRATAQAKRLGAEILTVLNVPGIESLTGAGVYYGAALAEVAHYKGEHIFVIGGANSAGQAAMFFSRYAGKVTMVVRSSALERGMSQYLVDQIEATPNIEVLLNSEIVGVSGTKKLEAIRIKDRQSEEVQEVQTPAMFIFIGAVAHTDFLDGVVDRNSAGFIKTGPDLIQKGRKPKNWSLKRDPFLLETSVQGIFAAGDVRQGAVRRVASAVGEGAIAVSLIHQYLKTV
jgi:thioredoxin reductase (NADPH)